VKEPLKAYPQAEKAICASFVALAPLADALRGTDIKLGAQDMFWEEQGAYTGEVAPTMLQGVCDLVIIGHSERRLHFGETNETVNKKIKAALAHALTPIVCVGESLVQNRAGETAAFVGGQVKAAFDGISAADAARIVIAYEPIWAIGTGLAATPEDANRIIGTVVRATLASLYGDATAQAMRIQYGGSIKPDNVDDLMKQPEIDGGLVGGASLKPEDFVTLVRAAAQSAAG
jgi:triosephosphate isomerase